jgi:antitoxin HigA-1
MHNPPHPGLVLREYLGNIPVTKAAAHLRITRVTLSRVLNGKAGISASMAIRLAAALGTTPELWMNMQSQYDLWMARKAKQPSVRRLANAADIAGDKAPSKIMSGERQTSFRGNLVNRQKVRDWG